MPFKLNGTAEASRPADLLRGGAVCLCAALGGVTFLAFPRRLLIRRLFWQRPKNLPTARGQAIDHGDDGHREIEQGKQGPTIARQNAQGAWRCLAFEEQCAARNP